MTERLEVDIIKCDGHGYCAELIPEVISLDRWGYPVLRKLDLTAELLEHAERAVRTCPVLALTISRRKR